MARLPAVQLRLGGLLLCALAAGGCENPATPPPTPGPGMLLVSVETVGDLPDPDGYEITRNGEAVGRVGINGSLRIENLEAGSYSIGLGGASLYCGIDGDSVRQAAVQRGANTTVTFRMECRRNGIAYFTHAERRTSLWVHFPGREPHLLVSGISGSRADWSPDGRRIVFAGTSGFPDLPGIGSGIFIIDLDSHRMTRIGWRNSSAPDWSPDGSRIAYTAYNSNCCGSLVTVSPDGSHDTVIWQSDSNLVAAATPAWSPDGGKIAFRRVSYTTAPSAIVVVDRNGSEPQVVRALRTYGSGLAWSPDGRRLLYGDQQSGMPFSLYTADAATGSETLLYRKPAEHVFGGSYIPEGRIGFYTRSSDRYTGLWTIQEEGSGLTEGPLPSDVAGAFQPAWQ